MKVPPEYQSEAAIWLRFRNPQTIAMAHGGLRELLLSRATPPDGACTAWDPEGEGATFKDDRAEFERVKDQCEAAKNPIVIIDLRGSTYAGTIRLGIILEVREVAVSRGGKCVALVDQLDAGAGLVLTYCRFDELLEVQQA